MNWFKRLFGKSTVTSPDQKEHASNPTPTATASTSKPEAVKITAPSPTPPSSSQTPPGRALASMNCAELKRVLEGGYFDMLLSDEKLDLRERMKEHRSRCDSCEEFFQQAYNAHKFREQAPLIRSALPPRMTRVERQQSLNKASDILDDLLKFMGSEETPKDIIAKRRLSGLCIACGKALGVDQKYRGLEQHPECKRFIS